MIFLLLCLSFLHHSQPPSSSQRFFFSFLLCVDLSLSLFYVCTSLSFSVSILPSLCFTLCMCCCFLSCHFSLSLSLSLLYHCMCVYLSVYVCVSLSVFLFLFISLCVSVCVFVSVLCLCVCLSPWMSSVSLTPHILTHTGLKAFLSIIEKTKRSILEHCTYSERSSVKWKPLKKSGGTFHPHSAYSNLKIEMV